MKHNWSFTQQITSKIDAVQYATMMDKVGCTMYNIVLSSNTPHYMTVQALRCLSTTNVPANPHSH